MLTGPAKPEMDRITARRGSSRGGPGSDMNQECEKRLRELARSMIVGADISAVLHEIDMLRHGLKSANKIVHNLTVAMQAALIDAHHNGPQAAIVWIENTLDGPGLLPDKADGLLGAQAFFDANMIGP
ncbi:MAG TPA: hypothetical protein DCZ95_18070 [Verrucomicrobia bacterium]|nr:hypothetical protein [Verrucomicrobiota bacterium]